MPSAAKPEVDVPVGPPPSYQRGAGGAIGPDGTLVFVVGVR